MQLDDETLQTLIETGRFAEEVAKALEEHNYNQILFTERFNDMKPGTEQREKLVLTRILSNNEEDFYFPNDVEVNVTTKERPDTSVPGNYDPVEGEPDEPDEDEITVSITGPTGDNRNYLPYIITGVGALVILIAGIALIKIKVIKTDGETEVPLQDVTFIVENSKGEIVDRIITDENGEATSKRLAIDEQYTVYEEKTKKGYILSNEKQVVELKENEIKDLKFNNYKEKGSIKITKVSSDGNNIAGIEFKITGISLTGETFEATYKTNENGEIFIDEVLTGEYTIEELQSELNSGYIIPEAQTITVENDKTAEVEFYNQLIETPKTDDGRNITLAIIVAVISLLGITTLAVMKTKKKNK